MFKRFSQQCDWRAVVEDAVSMIRRDLIELRRSEGELQQVSLQSGKEQQTME